MIVPDNPVIVVACIFAGLFAFALVVFARRRGAASGGVLSPAANARFGEIEIRLTETEHHLAQVRMQIGALPTKDSVHQLDLKITEAIGDMKAVVATSTATSRTVQRIEEHLLHASKEKGGP